MPWGEVAVSSGLEGATCLLLSLLVQPRSTCGELSSDGDGTQLTSVSLSSVGDPRTAGFAGQSESSSLQTGNRVLLKCSHTVTCGHFIHIYNI